jgi:hypothetical protein
MWLRRLSLDCRLRSILWPDLIYLTCRKHFAATTDPKYVARILRAMDGYEGSLVVKCALRLAPLLFVRPGELRRAEWAGIGSEGERNAWGAKP